MLMNDDDEDGDYYDGGDEEEKLDYFTSQHVIDTIYKYCVLVGYLGRH